jgi:adenosylmethionine-8-amino-7-oxononanoate aminotransferase
VGLLAAIEVVRDRESKEPFPNIVDTGWISNECFERGLIARALLQCVALSPPLCTTTADVDRMLEILASVWDEAEPKFAGKSPS